MTDKIIGSYGIIVPLLELHSILSKCKDPSDPHVVESIEDDDDDFDMLDPQTIAPPSSTDNPLYITNDYKSTIGKPVLKAHPYVVTSCASTAPHTSNISKNEIHP